MNKLFILVSLLFATGCVVDVTPEPVAAPDWKHMQYVSDFQMMNLDKSNSPKLPLSPSKPYISTDAK